MKYSELIQWTVNQTAMQLAACCQVHLPWIFFYCNFSFLSVTDDYIHKYGVAAMSLIVKLPRQKLGEEGFLRGDGASPHWQTDVQFRLQADGRVSSRAASSCADIYRSRVRAQGGTSARQMLVSARPD